MTAIKWIKNSLKIAVSIGWELKEYILIYIALCLQFSDSKNICYIKFNGIALQGIKVAFQNTFEIEKILTIIGATSILMNGYRDILTDLLLNINSQFLDRNIISNLNFKILGWNSTYLIFCWCRWIESYIKDFWRWYVYLYVS